MTVPRYVHRRGTTFDLSGTIDVVDNGAPVLDLTGWTGECKIKTVHGGLIAQAQFIWLDAAQRLIRIRVDDTDEWPAGIVETDILLTTPSGDKLATKKEQFEVAYGVT